MTNNATQPWTRGHAWLAGLLLAALAGIIFASQLRQHVAVQSDLMTPLIMARDCLDGRGCYFQINPFGDTTSIGVQHGALFNHVMTALLWLGGHVGSFQILTVAFTVLAVLLVFVTGRALLGQAGGQAAALIYLGLVWAVWPVDAGAIWNPSLLPLPAALYGAAASLYLRNQKLHFLMVAALACGIAMQAHAAAVVGVVGLFAMVAATNPEVRVQRSVVAGACFWASLQLVSPAMWIDTFFGASLVEGGWIAVGPALMGAAVIWRLVRPGARAAGSVPLFWAITAVPLVAFLSLARPEPRYVQFLLPGLALMSAHALAFLGERWRRKIAVGLTGVSVVLLVGAAPALVRESPPDDRELNLRDAAQLASYFQNTSVDFQDASIDVQRQRTYPDLFRHLRGGTHFWQLLNGLAYEMPGPALGPPTHDTDLAVLEVTATHEGPPPGWSFLPARGPLLLQEYLAFLRWDRFAHCAVDTTRPEPSCEWRGATYRLTSPVHPLDRELLATRACPGLPSMGNWPDCPISSLLRIPVAIPPHSEPRLIVAAALDSTAHDCHGQVVAVEGVEYAGPLPGAGVLLRGGPDAAAGVVTVAWSFCDCNAVGDRFLPPPVSELRPSDLPWLAPLLPDPERLLQLRDAARAWSWHPSGERSRLADAAGIDGGVLAEILAAAPGEIPAEEPAHQKQKEPLAPLWYVLLVTALVALVLLASVMAVARGSFPGILPP